MEHIDLSMHLKPFTEMAVILLMQNAAARLNLFFLQRGWLCLCCVLASV